MDEAYVETDINNQLKCKTYNFTVPSLNLISWILAITILAVIFNYFLTFKVGALKDILPKENYTNSDYYNENDYYKQYQ